MVSLRGSPIYPSVHSPTSPVQQSYPGGLTSWPLSRASFIASPRWQGPSSYAHLILPQGLVQVPNWNTYPVSLLSLYACAVVCLSSLNSNLIQEMFCLTIKTYRRLSQFLRQ